MFTHLNLEKGGRLSPTVLQALPNLLFAGTPSETLLHPGEVGEEGFTFLPAASVIGRSLQGYISHSANTSW